MIDCIFSCIIFAQKGWGRFQPTKAPTAIQKSVSNMLSPYAKGFATGGATTGTVGAGDVAGAVNGDDVATGIGAPVTAGGGVAVEAAATFSCVLPNAAIPNTAPIAT